LAAVEATHFDAATESAERVPSAIAQATGRPSRLSSRCSHNPPRSFKPGNQVALTIAVEGGADSAVKLHYRQVNQAERWQAIEMQNSGATFHAVIPAPYTESPFALQYYFEILQGRSSAGLYPGFDQVFANQPYFVVGRGQTAQPFG
jgi:hypothetical protein